MNQKQSAARRALNFICEGMTIGLGTGSTVYWLMEEIGELVRQGWKIRAVPTSRSTELIASEKGIPLTSLNEVSQLDLTVDGADEISPSFDVIKGAGGALVREKLVALASKQVIIIADSSKWVPQLGAAPVPVEVLPFAWKGTRDRLLKTGCEVALRLTADDQIFVTDNGNYIVDCQFTKIDAPSQLAHEIKSISGVVDSGLFHGIADVVILGYEDRTEVRRRAGS